MHGKNMKNYCIDCKKEICCGSVRCKSCANKFYRYERIKNRRKQDGTNNPNYKGGLPHCIDCKKELSTYKCKRCCSCETKRKYKLGLINNKGINHPNYGKKRPEFSKQILGDNNPNWQGGISFEPYSSEFNSELKEQIRKRDNYICQKCGKKQDSFIGFFKRLTIHHIDYDKDNNKENNLISLCNRCNSEVNAIRGYWKKFFTAILINRRIIC